MTDKITSPEQQLVCCPVSVTCCGGRRWRAPAGGSYIVLRLTVVHSYRERGAATGGSQVTEALPLLYAVSSAWGLCSLHRARTSAWTCSARFPAQRPHCLPSSTPTPPRAPRYAEIPR
jgi:hypothetical protein